MNPAELEFLSEEEELTIVPKFKLEAIKLLSTTIGPFSPNVPITVPLWAALFLRGQQKCRIMPPPWLTLEKLNECKEAEDNDSGCTLPPHSQYIEISTLLLQHAPEDIPNPESIRNIIRDVWDIRVGKLLSSVNGFLSSGSSTARVSQLTNMELATLHNLLTNSMDQLSLLRQATSQAVEFGGGGVSRTSFLNPSSVGN
ncbi:hypothetical protein MN116_006195 [Schistosoma mekongi]|uniref:DNA replication complex GINS protein PSF2 n=1 Tax=Schistosoma mekongi TaxID=38744 RepID=A0AAE1ZCC7_SCHME|nr:hypothetical protein MN116_006195 [Schistosoma mekongi]